MPRCASILVLLCGVLRVVSVDECDDVSCLIQMQPVKLASIPPADDAEVMVWNHQQIPAVTADQIGWSPDLDIVGPGVYGGPIKRETSGSIAIGDEWPENNRGGLAHNPVHATGPYLDFSKYEASVQAGNDGYTEVANAVLTGTAVALQNFFDGIWCPIRTQKTANLVMTGGARPLHMCGMGQVAEVAAKIQVLIDQGADVNAQDNYDMTPLDRFASNAVPEALALLQNRSAVSGSELSGASPDWSGDEFTYHGSGC